LTWKENLLSSGRLKKKKKSMLKKKKALRPWEPDVPGNGVLWVTDKTACVIVVTWRVIRNLLVMSKKIP
jgi:hypothetical protein